MTAAPDPRRPRILTTDASGAQTNIWWGIMGLIVIEVMVFGTLIVSYFYLKAHSTGWPPEPAPSLLLPTINTLVLFASSISIHIADKGVAAGSQRRLKAGLVGSTILAVVFLVLKWFEFQEKPYQWNSHAYGSIVFLLLGLHALHVFSVMLKSGVMSALAFRGFFSEQSYVGVQVNGLYWHFVVAIWLPIYVTVYLSPRFT
jgi:cytochrome c oxidase subunit III